ncbi:uncharacterized protein DUF397 [Actinomadura pelletieri DSM 43383]|uniref:Uncharacterized protein DUF397 n=1 Tax=Actinomadura pelletieri DSM 43383 TaxID=1120940 RepID=A0A495QXH8_9ACTN|nr:DUF397 domain-containing protein [Actinomadura pelletieri]RKS78899.1 uncharacterized protein DUF397 [Actinomadura pelletieri DSM 43383]
MIGIDLNRVAFRKSSYSEGGNGCVEAGSLGSRCLVRDSKNPEGGVLALSPSACATLLSEIKLDAHDL